MGNNRVKLKDIAEKAGISINSVSKALKNSPKISAVTKLRVKQIAKELGYIPDVHAQSLRNGSLNVIAVIYDNLINPYYSSMISILNEEFKNNNIESMFFVDHKALGHLSKSLAKRIISYRVSGILTFLEPTSEASEIIKQNKIPMVLVGRDGKETNTNSVYSDDVSGGILAAQKLIELNGSSFVYFTKHSELEINSLRLLGYKTELERNGIHLDDEHIVVGTSEVNGEEKLIELLKKDPTIDSIFCFSDLIAFEVAHCLQQTNYSVPNDINLVGFDNLQDYIPYPIKISSIDGGKVESIKQALSILTEQIENGYSDDAIYKKVDVFYQSGNTTKQK